MRSLTSPWSTPASALAAPTTLGQVGGADVSVYTDRVLSMKARPARPPACCQPVIVG
jgi:hypothetical protein